MRLDSLRLVLTSMYSLSNESVGNAVAERLPRPRLGLDSLPNSVFDRSSSLSILRTPEGTPKEVFSGNRYTTQAESMQPVSLRRQSKALVKVTSKELSIENKGFSTALP